MSDWPGPYYRFCEDPETCPVAYAYWREPVVPHWHFIGSPTAPAEGPKS